MSQSSVPTAATVPVRDDSLRAGQPPSGVGGGGTLLGHPKGLFLLFCVEMWERFSYYGMRGLLVLYLVNQLQWPVARATGLYGTYTPLANLPPLLGGLLADRVLGTRRSLVVGGVLIALGHFAL